MRKSLILTAAIVLFACPAALAAYPGRDGQLAVQPVRGGGIELVHANGVGAHRICTDARLCGRPVHPRFSPTGRAIVFEDARSTHIGVVALDGTCLWCLLGRPLTKGFGFDPAFASATAVTFTQETATSLSRASLTGGGTHRVAAAPATAAVTSSHGRLAVVRGSRIELRGPRTHRFTRLTTGAAPVWSPRGTALAFTRGSWIWTIAARHGARPRRLVRGTSPAWSPSGGRIAYVASGGAVTTITTGGRHRHRVGSVRGRSVDWQPLPHSPAACSVGNGAIVAQDVHSVVRQAVGAPNTTIGWNGCARAVGTHQHLFGGPHFEGCYDAVDLSAIAISGRYSAMSFSSCDHEGPTCSNVLRVFDVASGAQDETSEPSDDSCATAIDAVGVDSSGFAAWHVRSGPTAVSPIPTAVSCPSATLCVAVDDAGNAIVSSEPTVGSGGWTVVPLSHGALNAIACPTTSFCLATPDDGGVLTSVDPQGGASAWTFSAVDAGEALRGISCPAATFCALADSAGRVVTSTTPGAGAGAWTITPVLSVAPSAGLTGISCASASQCVAVDTEGDVITSTDPAVSPSTWTSAHVESGAGLNSISCPTTSFCAAQNTGHIVTSTNPTGGSAAWSDAAVTNAFGPIDCSSASLCVLPGRELLTSTDPSGGASAWTQSTQDSGAVEAASCPSDGFCVLAGFVSGGGRIYTSGAPAGGLAGYAATRVDQPACQLAGTPCDAESLYVHDDAGTRLVDSAPAGTGTVIANLSLSGDSTTLTWTNDGQPRSLQLH